MLYLLSLLNKTITYSFNYCVSGNADATDIMYSKLFQKLSFVALVIFILLIIFEIFFSQFSDNEIKEKPIALKLKENIVIKHVQTQQSSTSIVHKNESIDNNNMSINNRNNIQTTIDDSQITEAAAIVLWWTPFIGELEYTKNCGDSVCFFSGNRNYVKHEKLKVCYLLIQIGSET